MFHPSDERRGDEFQEKLHRIRLQGDLRDRALSSFTVFPTLIKLRDRVCMCVYVCVGSMGSRSADLVFNARDPSRALLHNPRATRPWTAPPPLR